MVLCSEAAITQCLYEGTENGINRLHMYHSGCQRSTVFDESSTTHILHDIPAMLIRKAVRGKLWQSTVT